MKIAFNIILLGTILLFSTQLFAKSVLIDAAAVKFTASPEFKGLSIATVEGDSAKGPHHSFLKFASGFEAPMHYHNANHYGAVIAGNFILIVDGKEQKFSPGSYFSFTDKSVHGTKCGPGPDCVIFLDARSKWDVVPEKKK